MYSFYRCYLDSFGPLDMPLVRHEDESNYVHRLATLLENAGAVKGLIELEAYCLDRPYYRYYLICDEDTWCRELDFDRRHQRGPACCLLG